MKVAICTIIKNEHQFLKEWIDYHLSIGFDHIYLYEDTGSLSHKDITDLYEEVSLFQYNEEIAKHEKRGGSKHQYALFEYFLETHTDVCDWLAFIDIDEFISIDGNLNIKDFLTEYEEYNGVYLYWKYYGASGHIYHPEGKVQDNYTSETDYEKDNGWRFKSIVNMKKHPKMLSNHKVKGGVNTFKLSTSRIRTFHKAHIKHYFTKSWEDWIIRIIQRGDLFPGHRKLMDFFNVNPDIIKDKDNLLKIYEEIVANWKQAVR